jgi:membrane protein
MYAIMQQLNVTYDVKETRGFLRARAVAIGLSILFGALMLVVFSLVVLGGVAQGWVGKRFGFSEGLLAFFAVLRWVLIVLALMLAFSLTYRLAPDVENNSFRFVSKGGAAGTLMLVAASIGFAVYVQNFANYQAIYGGIGAVIVLMLWLYIAGLSLLVGAEINFLVERGGR